MTGQIHRFLSRMEGTGRAMQTISIPARFQAFPPATACVRAACLAVVFLLFLTAGTSAQLPPGNPVREWTLPDRGTVQATLLTFDGTMVTLRFPNGQQTPVPLESLPEAERNYVTDWQEQQPVILPDSVGVESSRVNVEIVSENEKDAEFVYRTEHFDFTSDGKLTQNLLRDVARNFEATHALVKALPWGIQPEPEQGERFRALLVRSRQRYQEEGGAPNSGGIYLGSRHIFVVPFESLGITQLGKSFAKSPDYRSDTLVHELTHQMMHSTLPLLPAWVVEGTAEYTNILPLRFGIFRLSSAKTGLRDYLKSLKSRGGIPEPYPIEKLFGISPREWSDTLARNPAEARRMYFTSYLLVYYFMHLDGGGDGALFVKYMRAIGKTRRLVEDYRKALADFKKLPGVENLPNGRFRYPNSLTPPQEPEVLSSPEKREAFDKSTLGILLDGRSTAELMKQIRSAYRQVGITL